MLSYRFGTFGTSVVASEIAVAAVVVFESMTHGKTLDLASTCSVIVAETAKSYVLE